MGKSHSKLTAEDIIFLEKATDMSAEELKRYLPGTVLQMNNDTFGFTPLKRAVVVSSAGEVQVSFKAHGQAAGVLHPLPWWGQNVKRLVAGVDRPAVRCGAVRSETAEALPEQPRRSCSPGRQSGLETR